MTGPALPGRLRALWVLWLAALLLGVGASGCGKPKVECEHSGQCGTGEACIDSTCQQVACTQSADCGIYEFCNPKFECEAGCESNDDCQAGEFCGTESRQCYPSECRDTQLDCDYGEHCDQTTGDCAASEVQFCTTCDPSRASCGGGGSCVLWEAGVRSCRTTSDCNDGYYCVDYAQWGGSGRGCATGKCFDDCDETADDACPRGFFCQQLYTDDPTTYCFADCDYLNDNDLLP